MARTRPTSMTMSEARARFASVLARAERGHAVEVTRAGKPVAVVVSIEQYRSGKQAVDSPSRAFARFLSGIDRRRLAGADPWANVRDGEPGRDVRW